MTSEESNLIKAYNYAEQYLKDKAQSNGIQNLDRYFTADGFKTKNDILKRLINSLQNRQHFGNVIKLGKNKSRFERILFNYDAEQILQKYHDDKEILDIFEREFDIKPSDTWIKFSKSVYSASVFMTSFKDHNDFDSFVRLFLRNELTREALPMLLAQKVYGLGFALASDFLKELGYYQYSKPDVHLKEVFYKLKLSDNTDLGVCESINKMAKAVKKTPYQVDKTFWLICSGKFYKDDKTTGSSKDDFIEKALEELDI